MLSFPVLKLLDRAASATMPKGESVMYSRKKKAPTKTVRFALSTK
jgi:hypothetical protein